MSTEKEMSAEKSIKKSIKPYVEKRPWGEFERFTQNELSTVKIITVNPHEQLSLQYHEKRSEFWKVLSGNPILTVGDVVVHSQEGGEFFELPKEKHRIQAGDEPVRILEIAFGDFEEGDIVRLDDKYGRT